MVLFCWSILKSVELAKFGFQHHFRNRLFRCILDCNLKLPLSTSSFALRVQSAPNGTTLVCLSSITAHREFTISYEQYAKCIHCMDIRTHGPNDANIYKFVAARVRETNYQVPGLLFLRSHFAGKFQVFIILRSQTMRFTVFHFLFFSS